MTRVDKPEPAPPSHDSWLAVIAFWRRLAIENAVRTEERAMFRVGTLVFCLAGGAFIGIYIALYAHAAHTEGHHHTAMAATIMAPVFTLLPTVTVRVAFVAAVKQARRARDRR